MRAAIWRSPSAARGQPRRSRRRARPFAKITMRAVGATGWTVSSIGPVHRYGGALEIGSKTSIRKTRFFYAQSLRSEISPKQWIPTERSPPDAPETITGSASQEGPRRLLRSQPRRLGFGQPGRGRAWRAMRTYHGG